MKLISILILIHSILVSLTSGQRFNNSPYKYGYSFRAVTRNSIDNESSLESGCSRNPCGIDAICYESNNRKATCACPSGYKGDPLTNCHRGECQDSEDCRDNQACENSNCMNPCIGQCGLYAKCSVRNHIPVCSCPENFRGDPTVQCLYDYKDLCDPSPCGVNTECKVINNQASCSCISSFIGNPLIGCRHECESDEECEPQELCHNFKCIRSCSQCGRGSSCTSVINHKPTCECPKGFIGSPFIECRPECYTDADCEGSKPACTKGVCKNPCEGACGVNAECKYFKNIFVICTCPAGMSGDPFKSCEKLPEDPCKPNPCGINAMCRIGYDRSQHERAICMCPPGFTGNALQSCVRGECLSDSECADNKTCMNYKCEEICNNEKCGIGAICDAKNHVATCSCPEGTFGDALISCRLPRSFAVARYIK